MRTFIAAEIDDAARNSLGELIAALSSRPKGVKWVKTENVHVTLKFIGELTAEQAQAAGDVLCEVAEGFRAVRVRLAGVGAFPDVRRPRVIHVRVDDGGALGRLNAALEEQLDSRLGVAPERRRYVPHITLGRCKAGRPDPALAALLGVDYAEAEGEADVGSVALFESRLTPGGAIYRPLKRVQLARDEGGG